MNVPLPALTDRALGVIGVNTGNTSYEGAPFGGLKASGIGREGSRLGIDEFLETKYVCVAGVAH